MGSELTRIVELMTAEILPREKQMHDMIESMQQAYASATQQMHAAMSGAMQKGGLGSDQDKQRQQLLGPMQEMESEINRIRSLLGHGEVRPDIQGWKPQTQQGPPKSPRSGARAGSPGGA